MDLDVFNAVLRRLDVDLWTLIDTAISVAIRDSGKELRLRRDGIVEQLYSTVVPRCPTCHQDDGYGISSMAKEEQEERAQSRGADDKGKLPNEEGDKRASPSVTPSPNREEDDDEDDDTEEEDYEDQMRRDRSPEDEQSKILAIKERFDDPDQSEDSLVQMLQTLADMDIKFKLLKATDIGRQVNGLRKHPSAEVRRLVKHLVRKWKEMVDDWVKKNSVESASPSAIPEGEPSEQNHGDSRQNKNQQIPDFGLSPSIHASQKASDQNGSWSSRRGSRETEGDAKTKTTAAPLRKEAPTPPTPPLPGRSAPAKEQKASSADSERLASARKRLHENYQEAENAKKQRTIQVMDIHDIPRPKNSFLRSDHRGPPGKRKG